MMSVGTILWGSGLIAQPQYSVHNASAQTWHKVEFVCSVNYQIPPVTFPYTPPGPGVNTTYTLPAAVTTIRKVLVHCTSMDLLYAIEAPAACADQSTCVYSACNTVTYCVTWRGGTGTYCLDGQGMAIED